MRSKPLSTEYPAYHESYIRLIPEGDIVKMLSSQQADHLTVIHDKYL